MVAHGDVAKKKPIGYIEPLRKGLTHCRYIHPSGRDCGSPANSTGYCPVHRKKIEAEAKARLNDSQ